MDATEDVPGIDELQAFLHVVDLGSFTAAARRLDVPKSTVSRRLTRLEDKLGVRLLERTTRQLRLTDAGQAYHERISAALETMREAGTAAREFQEVAQGHLRVTAPPDLGVALGELLTAFTERHPKVTVEVELTGRNVDLVGEGFDLAIRAAHHLADSSLVARRVMTSDICLYASTAYLARRGMPKQVEDLRHHDCVLFRASRGRARWRLWPAAGGDEAEEVDVTGRISANDFHFILSAVRAHAGVAPLPANTVIDDLADGGVQRVLPAYRGNRAGIFVVSPGARRLPAKARVLVDFAMEWLRRELNVDLPPPSA